MLYWTAEDGYQAIVQLLLEHKADSHVKTESGWIYGVVCEQAGALEALGACDPYLNHTSQGA